MFRPSPSTQSLRSLADEDLMELVRGGNARAFEIVFDRHSGPAFSLAYRMCGRRATAEDIVQEALLSVWRSAARYDRTRGSVRSWVLRVVHNRAVDVFRGQATREVQAGGDPELLEAVEAPDRTDREVEIRDDARHVRSALFELPDEQRRVIELAYFGGFTHSQIADVLDLPAGTVKGRMRLGLSKLRIALGDAADVVV